MVQFKFSMVFLCCVFFCAPGYVQSQDKKNHRVNRSNFEGNWFNKKTQRHLLISYEKAGYFTINDWLDNSNGKERMIDAYKAVPKEGKLIMPESTGGLRAPYAEILRSGKFLLYRTKAINNPRGIFIDNIWFSRYK